MPNGRTAALMRWIHSARKVRFLRLRSRKAYWPALSTAALAARMVFLRRPQKPLACSSTFLCRAWATTPLFTRAMSFAPYGRPLGRYVLMILASDADITLVPRFWRMYFALWLISR